MHFGGGPDYCAGCARDARPCAGGEPGSDGKRCTYIEHEPLSEAGWQAWDVLVRFSGQLRMAAVCALAVGLDLAAAICIGRALNYDPYMLAELLPCADAGLVAAIHRHSARMPE